MTYEELKKVNEELKRVPIHGKEYALVSSRVQAFRKLYPEGRIETAKRELEPIITYDEEGKEIRRQRVVGFWAYIYKSDEKEYPHFLADGYAEEIEGSSTINKEDFAENCQTSAVGRALAFLGIGSDDDIASAEEVVEAEGLETISKEKAQDLRDYIKAKNGNEAYICKYHKVKSLEDMTIKQFAEVVKYLERGKK